MSKPDLGDYVEVHDRISAFYERFPEGSLQSSWEIRELDGQTILVVTARAYRTPDDQRPGVGHASEPVPGLTPYTKNSELMVGETSAWGRAIAALGFEVKRGIASANEVRARQNAGESKSSWAISDKQRGFLERLLKQNGVEGQDLLLLNEWASETLTGGKAGSASEAIDGLQNSPELTVKRLLAAARKWDEGRSDMPADTEGLGE